MQEPLLICGVNSIPMAFHCTISMMKLVHLVYILEQTFMAVSKFKHEHG